MRELFNLISKNKETKDCVLVTGIDGELAGQKLLFVDEKVAWRSENPELLEKCQEDLLVTETVSVCDVDGGQAFVERMGMSTRIIVCGCGTVGKEVIKLGHQLGYTVVALEDRQEFADEARKLGADEVVCAPFAEAIDSLDERIGDYYVVVTREHKYDKVCLEAILDRKSAYVGMMSSRNRARILKETLISEGKSQDSVDKIHSPIGLSINAESPAEIAVSIFAEIIMARNSLDRSEGFTGKILEAILGASEDEPLILATIVKRDGSAPRDVGTKMVIRQDGTIVGTVGGGWIEAGVIKKACEMFEEGKANGLYEMEKDSENAMLCGGFETVYLERI
ncbi:MAG: XdhC family protein [Eubacterium sp.]|nr:XdhC family protein [Candidatus Colimonas fimequi]